MAGGRGHDVGQYGDFQTPLELAATVCALLVRLGVTPATIVEPSCGEGAFLVAAAAFAGVCTRLGVEIDPLHVGEARARLGGAARVEEGDFFALDWEALLGGAPSPWLILGNPPWVTNAALGRLNGTNLPEKSNFQGRRGLDAITGKANFDISETMLMRQIGWLEKRCGWLAVLVKTAVARKVLRQLWRRQAAVGRGGLYRIDAMRHFAVAVEAALLVLPVGRGGVSQECDVYDRLDAAAPVATFGLCDGIPVSDVGAYLRHRRLIGADPDFVWRSGVKHDCVKVMELTQGAHGRLVNGLGERVEIESDFVYPLLKSSDVAKGRGRTDRFMLLAQHRIGDDPGAIAAHAPRCWAYLNDHAPLLDARASRIYRGRPRFGVFGIGPYTFAPWKVAVSGFYKEPHFSKAGSAGDKPTVFDDTVYFLACDSEAEADRILSLVRSRPYAELLGAMIFRDDKRPVTAEVLRRIALKRVAKALGIAAP
jgi:hypothetical protein